MHRPLAITVAWSSLALLTACGGKVIFEQTSGAGGAPTTNVTSTGTVFGAKSSTGVGTGGATGFSSAVSTDGATVGTTVGATTATVGVSASSGGPPPSVWCNGQPCNGADTCCFNPNGPGDYCNAPQAPCMGGYVELKCSQPADCPGEVCCASVDPMGNYQGIACAPECKGPGAHIICTKNPSVCPAGQSCHQSMTLGNGYRICY